MGKEWTTAEPDNEIKLVFDSQGLQEVLPALAFHLFNAKLGFCLLGRFVNLSTCMGFPNTILKVLSSNSMGYLAGPGGTSGSLVRVSSKPHPFSVLGDQVSPHAHHERATLRIRYPWT